MVKGVAERQYLIFNLLAGGKLAYDAGNFAVAAAKWEALLRIPALDPEIDRVMRPLAQDARARASGSAAASGARPPAVVDGTTEPPLAETPTDAAAARPSVATVSGIVSGGGVLGPGGTVI